MSSLHQLAIGLNIKEKTLLSWNRHFGIQPTLDAEGQPTYTSEQKDLVLKIYRLIKEQGLTIAAVKEEIKRESVLEKRTETIEKLLEIKEFLKAINERL